MWVLLCLRLFTCHQFSTKDRSKLNLSRWSIRDGSSVVPSLLRKVWCSGRVCLQKMLPRRIRNCSNNNFLHWTLRTRFQLWGGGEYWYTEKILQGLEKKSQVFSLRLHCSFLIYCFEFVLLLGHKWLVTSRIIAKSWSWLAEV